MKENQQSTEATPQNYKQRVERPKPLVMQTSLKSQACITLMTVSPDFLDIPAMLFFFLHELMSFLTAKNSQMSCRKPRVQWKNILHIFYMPHALMTHYSTHMKMIVDSFSWCLTLPVELWRAQSTLTGRGWSPPEFLLSHLRSPLWSLNKHKNAVSKRLSLVFLYYYIPKVFFTVFQYSTQYKNYKTFTSIYWLLSCSNNIVKITSNYCD